MSLWTWLPSALSFKPRQGYRAAPSILPTSCRFVLEGCGNIGHITRIKLAASQHMSLLVRSCESGVSSNASSSSLALDMQTEQNAPEPIIFGGKASNGEFGERSTETGSFASLKRTPPGADTSGVSGMLGGDGRVRKEEVDSSKSKKCKMSAMSETDASFSCMSSG
ncbi:hypothetical protein EJB05_54163 [Eragrostis curvula]|uniref:Uncharacterized protein n=1 Tax=Eragrostis curvula TaxID=38414 RepID=A0A5J9SN25_9POAL|nr:hypothetical protein EJB05_54163 [Eragrostis curvula]